jgi:hypothetical protein
MKKPNSLRDLSPSWLAPLCVGLWWGRASWQHVWPTRAVYFPVDRKQIESHRGPRDEISPGPAPVTCFLQLSEHPKITLLSRDQAPNMWAFWGEHLQYIETTQPTESRQRHQNHTLEKRASSTNGAEKARHPHAEHWNLQLSQLKIDQRHKCKT